MAQYLRQLKSGHIYIRTPTLAKRKDMVPYDPAIAKARIAQLKRELEDRQPNPVDIEAQQAVLSQLKQDAKEMTELENQLNDLEEKDRQEAERDLAPDQEVEKQQPLTEEEIQEKHRKKTIEKDDQIISIMAMRSRNQIEEYMLREFGREIDRSRPFQELKDEALKAREERIFEE